MVWWFEFELTQFGFCSPGEWWNDDVDKVEKEMLKTGAGAKVSDAYTLNGLPGPLYPCSTKGPIFSLNR